MLGDHRHILGFECLGQGWKTDGLAGPPQELQAWFAQPGKGVGRPARLEHPAAQHGGACLGYRLGYLHDLAFRLDRSGTGDHREWFMSESGRSNLDDRFGF